MSLSSCGKTFKLKKVNKNFVPEPISCFRIPICVYEHYVYFTYPYHGYVTPRAGRVFAIGPGDLGSISGCVIPKTLKMVLDTSLLNTQQYKVHIKGKVEQSKERSSALPYTSV